MAKIKVLNLYAGIGGNRALWDNDKIEVTAVEIYEDIAGEYKSNFPNDTVIIGDAHEYLIRHYMEFDFIWTSPPCPTHSVLNYSMKEKRYASMILYQEIILLQNWFKGKFVVENVQPYYDYLIKPSVLLGRHPFWTNFKVIEKEFTNIDISRANTEELAKDLGLQVPNCQKARLLLKNCVNPKIGEHLFNAAYKENTMGLNAFTKENNSETGDKKNV